MANIPLADLIPLTNLEYTKAPVKKLISFVLLLFSVAAVAGGNRFQAICVGAIGKWGNPFYSSRTPTLKEAAALTKSATVAAILHAHMLSLQRGERKDPRLNPHFVFENSELLEQILGAFAQSDEGVQREASEESWESVAAFIAEIEAAVKRGEGTMSKAWAGDRPAGKQAFAQHLLLEMAYQHWSYVVGGIAGDRPIPQFWVESETLPELSSLKAVNDVSLYFGTVNEFQKDFLLYAMQKEQRRLPHLCYRYMEQKRAMRRQLAAAGTPPRRLYPDTPIRSAFMRAAEQQQYLAEAGRRVDACWGRPEVALSCLVSYGEGGSTETRFETLFPEYERVRELFGTLLSFVAEHNRLNPHPAKQLVLPASVPNWPTELLVQTAARFVAERRISVEQLECAETPLFWDAQVSIFELRQLVSARLKK